MKHKKNEEVNQFFKNRIMDRKKQLLYWAKNWRSGLIRLIERLLIGTNISDRLGGDLSQFSNHADFSQQVREVIEVSDGRILEKVEIKPIGSTRIIELNGIKRPRRIIKIDSAKVDIYTGLVRTETGLILDSVLSQWQKTLYMGGLLDAYSSAMRSRKKLIGTWAVLPCSEYYFHTLTEEIATLLAIREKIKNFSVIVHYDSPSWAIKLLEELEFNYQISNSRGFEVETLLVSTSIGSFSSVEFDYFSSIVKESNGVRDKKIFVSRKGLSRGDDELESEVIAILASRGFEVINPEDLTIRKQMEIFYNSIEIISFHGGALSNLVWCQKGTRVLEIFNHAYRSYDFARIAYEGKLEYQAIDLSNRVFNEQEIVAFLNTDH